MNTTIINFTTDPKLKSEAQKVAKSLGIPLSLALNNYLRQLVKTKTVTFREEEPSKYLIGEINAAEKELKSGKVSPTFQGGKQAVEWLEKNGI